MQEITALRAMLDYKTFVKYHQILSSLDNLQKEHRTILNTIKDYYERYPDKKDLSVDELETYFFHMNPAINEESYRRLFESIKNTRVDNPELINDILNQVVERHVCSKVATIATDVAQGVKVNGIEEIDALIQEYRDIVGNLVDPYDIVCRTPLEELLRIHNEEGLKWSLKFLNNTLGYLKPKTLGHVFARPDGGKTSLALHQIGYFAWQLKKQGKEMLFMNNEEDINIVRKRLYTVMVDNDLSWIDAHPEEAKRKFEEKGGDNILLIGGVGHIYEVEKYLNTFRPYAAVIDQGPKVWYPGRDLNTVDRLQRLYNKYRELAKKYDCIFISIGQADNASEGKKLLGLNNFDSSKVGIPGELDWALGIGRVHQPGYEEVRYLNIAKNKLTGRYGQTEVHFNAQKCRYEDR